jgi:hypothetical protein
VACAHLSQMVWWPTGLPFCLSATPTELAKWLHHLLMTTRPTATCTRLMGLRLCPSVTRFPRCPGRPQLAVTLHQVLLYGAALALLRLSWLFWRPPS